MSELTSLPNIGEKLCRQLEAVGIRTAEELRAVGSRGAWLRIQAMDPSACLLRLRALEGAVQGVKRDDLPEEEKQALREFYFAHKLRK